MQSLQRLRTFHLSDARRGGPSGLALAVRLCTRRPQLAGVTLTPAQHADGMRAAADDGPAQ